MSQELRYGAGCSVRLDLPHEAVLADFSTMSADPLDDPAAATAAALAHPLGFPALAQAVTPGDRIVLALDQGVPQAGAVLSGILHTLLGGETEPEQITIVRARDQFLSAADLAAVIPGQVAELICIKTHDPHDKSGLAYLAAARDGKPIYLNRDICDADIVLPISALRLESSPGYVGVHGGLFPAFADEETQQRFRVAASSDWEAHRRQRREEATEAAWLLGVQFTIQVVPGPGTSVLHILAGDAHEVEQRGRALCEAAWARHTPRRASLVVATIEGGPDQQTWDNFARALFSAARVVADEGTIVLCTDLECRPGPALQRLAAPGPDVRGQGQDDRVLRQIRRDRSADALSASLLIETRERARVCLLSRLDGNVVEELGVGYVADGKEIERLSRQHESCILLANADHAIPTALDDLAGETSDA